MSISQVFELTPADASVLTFLRDCGPKRLSQLNEEAVDHCFKARPRLVRINAYGSDPLLDITEEGMRALARWERKEIASADPKVNGLTPAQVGQFKRAWAGR